MTGVLVSAGLLALAVVLAAAAGLGVARELAVAAVRAGVQLAVVGLVIAVVFEQAGLAAGFIAVMLTAAALTAGRRLRPLARGRLRAAAAIGAGAASALVPLLALGAFSTRPQELVPVAGILIGGAMAACSLTGRRLLEAVADGLPAIEARLALGVSARTALAPAVRTAVATGLVPALDQTKNVGLVTLPGTFVGLLLGGASPARAAAVQLTVLLAILAVQTIAALTLAGLVARALVCPGERVVLPDASPDA